MRRHQKPSLEAVRLIESRRHSTRAASTRVHGMVTVCGHCARRRAQRPGRSSFLVSTFRSTYHVHVCVCVYVHGGAMQYTL